MTTSADLRVSAVNALLGSTIALHNVFSPRDLSTWDGEYPMLIITTPDEDGEGRGRIGAPQFNVTTTLRVLGRVQFKGDDISQAVGKVYEALETLRDQIKRALINHPDIMSQLQQYPFFRVRIDEAGREDSGYHQGQVVVDVGMEFYQGPADFYQGQYLATETLTAQIPASNGTERTGAVINIPD